MRRGEMESNLVALIILLASIMIGIVIIASINGAWRSEEMMIDCSAEVRAHATVQQYSKELVSPSSIRCPTNRLVVDGEEPAKAVIASEMLRCFDQWGRGELALFGDQTGTYCHVCSMIVVQGTPHVRGLTEYLDTHKAGRGDLTYLQALIGATRGDLYVPENAPAAGEDTISTAQPIAVIFRYEKGAQTTQQVSNWISDPKRSAPAGFAGGLVIGIGVGASGGTVALLAIGGSVASAVVGYVNLDPLDTVASVSARPLDAAGISALGCDYLPVEDD